MESSFVEVKLISCRDLKAFNYFQKLSVYAVVSLVSDEMKKTKDQQHLQRQKTAVDRDGDRNPEWNHEMRFDLKDPEWNHLFLKFDLRSEGTIFRNKTIGEVRVPLEDLIDDFHGGVRFVSYQVRNCDGKPNGVLNFSYKMNEKIKKNGVTGKTISKVESSSGIDFSSDKVHYPTLEVEKQSRLIRYPSLDDDLLPSPRITIPSPKIYYPTPESYSITTPTTSPLPFLPPAGERGMCYHPYHALPSMQIPGTYWCSPESLGYGYTLSGYPGVGQFRIVEGGASMKGLGSGGDVFPDSQTTSSTWHLT